MNASVLYIDAYYTGSHRHTADLFQSHSSHNVEILAHGLDHWRWLANAAHFELIAQIQQRTSDVPDVLIFSGPLNIPALVSRLPNTWRNIPRAVYFHESQWIYPTADADVTHHLVNHIDAVLLAQQVWFNSQFHRDAFWSSAVEHPNPRLRKLAQGFLPSSDSKTLIMYPPVTLETGSDARGREKDTTRIAWVARWEAEKRPDIFARAMRQLADGLDVNIELLILGPGSGPDRQHDPYFREVADLVKICGPLPDRREYEAALRIADIVVSTAEHEFFGIAILEASLAGALPVLPAALAYPETLPSAWFYRPGDVEDLVRTLRRAIEIVDAGYAPWKSDAGRFNLGKSVQHFDRACSQLTNMPGSNPG